MATASRRRLPSLLGRRNWPRPEEPIEGVARLGARTKHLVKRLRPGDVAVIDHVDIDRIAAEELIEAGVIAVLNASPSSQGRYPNAGPLMLAREGIRLVDAPDAGLFECLKDGDRVRIVDGTIFLGEEEVAHVREETDILTVNIAFPPTKASFRDRHVLIVVRGDRHRRDLKALRSYIRDVRPLIVAVDGGANGILEAGLTPDVILGDMDSAGDEALCCGAELIVHAYPDGRAPGRERLLEAGLDHQIVPAAGTSEDVAMLMAHEKGAALIVSVGAHFNLVE